jgi:hypothetical protein
MGQQMTISILTAPTAGADGVSEERVYLVGRTRSGVRYVAPETYSSEHEAEIALELGLVTPSFLWRKLVGKMPRDLARNPRTR